ncbi:MAG: hypothetical protein H6667_12025 [Ardenticatenaceae bacterium]|nr:hypothetical protein [Ardenticatenaceae bacterium]
MRLGGAAATEIFPALKSTLGPATRAVPRQIVKELFLKCRGWNSAESGGHFAPQPDGRHDYLWQDDPNRRRNVNLLKDAERYPAFRQQIARWLASWAK